VSTSTKPERRTRAVLLLDLRKHGGELYDPALDDGSKSPILGVSFGLLSRLRDLDDGALAARGRAYRLAVDAGKMPPPNSVNLDDWWDIARWVLEHRRVANIREDNPDIGLEEAREQAGLDVAQMLAPIRELLR
jgi:hypothetical protein